MIEDTSDSKGFESISDNSVPDSYVDLDILLSQDDVLATQSQCVDTLYMPSDKPSK